MYRKETIYIAGPECFFENGKKFLASYRLLSEAKGHDVSLPNDTKLNLNHKDLRKNADEIFSNLKEIMYDTTMIISDLDTFRGAEPDSGTVYEIGMAYARNLFSYAYTKDLRPLIWKDQALNIIEGKIVDEHKNIHHYSFLPFSPFIMASTKVIEGDFGSVMKCYDSDVYFGFANSNRNKGLSECKDNIFVAIRNFYDTEENKKAEESLSELKKAGYNLIFPYFEDYKEDEEVSKWLKRILLENLNRLDSCKTFVADLNNYRGYECSNDIAFLCGYAFQKGKELIGYMDDTRDLISKVPNIIEDGIYKDIAKREVENFNYPINLMFSSSMKIYKGDLSNISKFLHKNFKDSDKSGTK